MKASLAERWVAAAEAAVELSVPSEIVAHIRAADAPDDGLRAASYEARVRSGHLTDSHPERLVWATHEVLAGKIQRTKAEHRVRDSWKRDDEIRVSRHGLRFIDAISAINAARDHGTVDTWDEAVKDAGLMAELHASQFISSAIDTADDLDPYHATIRAVGALTKLAHRWGCPHIATIQERLRHPDVCLSHARVGIERPVCGQLVVCKMCRDKIADWGDPLKEHRDPDAWPWAELLTANETGQRSDYRRLNAEYLASHGVSPHVRRFRVS